ncbi:hypothetical protein BpHYR1_021592 [Brachionus plicatilis]|uniref:Uncharacterized protein n=1 Tax=Brachionus plicatilis TaxID=10195 RepID=A0A3M7REF3_BRAPC|nr:hypothetical protein BpHYR1_021592 [Brachionus plicatilis]
MILNDDFFLLLYNSIKLSGFRGGIIRDSNFFKVIGTHKYKHLIDFISFLSFLYSCTIGLVRHNLSFFSSRKYNMIRIFKVILNRPFRFDYKDAII